MKNEAIKNIVEHSARAERSVESYLTMQVRNLGGICLKYFNAAETGYPDRIVILPGKPAAWVELKGARGRLRPLQAERIGRLRRLGQYAAVCGSREAVDVALKEIAAL